MQIAMRKRALAAVLAGVATGIGIVIFFSTSLLNSTPTPQPPVMTIIVDNQHYKAGIGPYGGTFPNGTVYGMEVDSSYTLPEETIHISDAAEIVFAPESPEKTQLRESWILDQDSRSQFFLEKLEDYRFRLPDEVPPGDYILTVKAVYDDRLVTRASYNHKVQIS